MNLSLRDRMVVTAMAASGIALGALLALAGPPLAARAREDARSTLLAEARLMGRIVEEALASGIGPGALDGIVDEAAREVHARVTVIAPDGRVLADSALSGAALLAMDNHASRPEVKSALADRPLSIERYSATVGAELLYTAVPLHHDGAVVGVARLSRHVDTVDAQGRELWWGAARALAFALVATGLLTLALSQPLARVLRQTLEAARRFARGDLTARIPAGRNDELGELARVINHAAEELQQQSVALTRDRARTDAVLAALGDGVLALDHAGQIVLANARLREALRLGDPLGHHYLEVVRERQVVLLIEEVLRSGERRTAEVELQRSRQTYTITAVPFPGAEPAPHGVVLTFDDATERRRLERVRRDFVANASHELRTPLTSIRGFVEALEDGAIDEPATAQRFLAKIHTHADRMTTLLGDLLSLSRLEHGDAPEWSPVQPHDLAREAQAAFEDLAARKGISLSTADRGAPVVVTDPERLRRILEGFLDNAVKYTPQGGHVEIATSAAAEGGARVDVSDDGPGIEAVHLPRIFERFYRVDRARSRELGGTGLGLSIVRHLADGMGATVSAASTPGRGSCFTVLLPASPADVASDAETGRSRDQA